MFGERKTMSSPSTTLLLVDDDEALRHLLSLILTHAGYSVRTAQDGFSALAAIRAEVPDILLSDLYMPGMSGFELLSVVRRRFPLIHVIAMSSAYAGPDVPTGVAADAFYEKATDLHALLGIVKGIQYVSDGSTPCRRDSVAPIWVGWKPNESVSHRIVLSCPDCLRTFFLVRPRSKRVVHEATCLYCLTRISYALVLSAIPRSSEARPPVPMKMPMRRAAC